MVFCLLSTSLCACCVHFVGRNVDNIISEYPCHFSSHAAIAFLLLFCPFVWERSDCRIAFSPAVIDFLPPAYRASLVARARDYLRASVIEERLGLFNASDIPFELKVDALDSVMLLVYGENEVEIMSTTELVDVKANSTDSRVTFIFQSTAKKSPCVPFPADDVYWT
jgi:hypothetical protein